MLEEQEIVGGCRVDGEESNEVEVEIGMIEEVEMEIGMIEEVEMEIGMIEEVEMEIESVGVE
jgi:hypothetical protein